MNGFDNVRHIKSCHESIKSIRNAILLPYLGEMGNLDYIVRL